MSKRKMYKEKYMKKKKKKKRGWDIVSKIFCKARVCMYVCMYLHLIKNFLRYVYVCMYPQLITEKYSITGIIISHVNLLFSSTLCLVRGCPRDMVQAAPTCHERPFWRPWKIKPSSRAEIGTTQTQSLTNSRVSPPKIMSVIHPIH